MSLVSTCCVRRCSLYLDSVATLELFSNQYAIVCRRVLNYFGDDFGLNILRRTACFMVNKILLLISLRLPW